jgi:signal transduction histidine kinase
VKKSIVYFSLFVAFLVAAVLAENLSVKDKLQVKDIQCFTSDFRRSVASLNEETQQLKSVLAAYPDTNMFRYVHRLDNEDVTKQGIALFVYDHDSLVYWTDNQLFPARISGFSKGSNVLLKRPEGWYWQVTDSVAGKYIRGLLLIKRNYPISNHYVSNQFNRTFSLPDFVEISTDSTNAAQNIYAADGQFVMSLNFVKSNTLQQSNYVLWSLAFYLLAYIMFLIVLQSVVLQLVSSNRKIIGILSIFAFLLALRQILLQLKIPYVVYNTQIFSPFYFSHSQFLPSLGDLMILISIVLFLIFNFYAQVSFLRLSKGSKIKLAVFRYVLILLLLTAFFTCLWLFENLIMNSTLNFEPHKILNISLLSLLAIVSISFCFLAVYFIAEKTIQLYRHTSTINMFRIHFLAFYAVVVAAMYLIGNEIDWVSVILFALLVLLGTFIWQKKGSRFKYHIITSLILIYSVFAVYFINKENGIKQHEENKVIALRLASERDPVAENLLSEISDKLQNDSVLNKIIGAKVFQYNDFYAYLKRRYFSGFWDKYDFQVTICKPNDTLRVEPDNSLQPCFAFFEQLIGQKGDKVPLSAFYFLNNDNGRISYLGVIAKRSFTGDCNVYIQLDSRLVVQDLGYPDLLLDNKIQNKNRLDDFTYARYYNNRLIAQSGNFPYNLTLDNYRIVNQEYNVRDFKGYSHLFYQPDDKNVLILSVPIKPFSDLIISFSYLFVLFFTLYNLVLILVNIKRFNVIFNLNFENKIKLSIIASLLVALVIVGAMSLYLSVKQVNTKHNGFIREKMQSIYREMSQRMEVDMLSNNGRNSIGRTNLEDILIDYSNVFYCDINIFSTNGLLIASSRPEIFDKRLVGTMMNSVAFREMSVKKRSEYIQDETIGSLKFMSAYAPLINSSGKTVAYLNLPYFSRQDEIKSEITNMLFTLLNFYVLLILFAGALAVVISRKITQPLRWIEDNMRSIKLGGKFSKISYSGSDEIGSLVLQYNKMLDELEKNVELLARSERELAWREMARQVAHEIKNPLTPMKLSVQHLQRAWNDKAENWDEYLSRVTHMLVEQIDHLSFIANEFSNFAKMPKPNNVKLNLQSFIKETIALYQSGGTDIRVNVPDSPVFVLADKEQMNRVVINLINNALQSIPFDRAPDVSIHLLVKENRAFVEVCDNGNGVEPEIGDKLFEPNFTTKTSGMGLGLAMVKSIVANSGGKIYYESQPGVGTVFTVELPLM